VKIGSVALESPFALAPMAGMTDTAFRRLVKRRGGCGLVVTEMVSSEGLVRGIDRTLEYAEYTEEERPVSIQIFGGDPGRMAEAAQVVEGMGADMIDVNMGCPVPKIAKHQAGCSLMRTPEHAATVVGAMTRAVSIPVTVKMRAGWDDTHINALDVAGALPEVFITAWDALVLQGGLCEGGTALVHAGASGVGTAAIQLCRRLGAAVVVTASAGKVARCLDLGADRAVDYATEDWVAVVDELTDGRGADVVLDVIGGDYLDRNADALAVGGTIMQVGLMGGGAATFGLGKLLAKRASLVGTTLRARSLDEKVALSRAFEDEVVPGFEDGSLDVVVDRRYRLADIAEGHAYMETNASVGKIVLDIAAG